MDALHFQKFWNGGVGGVGWDKVGLCVARGLESTPPHDLIEIDEN